MLAPMARRISTPRKRVSAGTTITPPPSPTNEPKTPAAMEISRMMSRYSSGDTSVLASGKSGGGRSVARELDGVEVAVAPDQAYAALDGLLAAEAGALDAESRVARNLTEQ